MTGRLMGRHPPRVRAGGQATAATLGVVMLATIVAATARASGLPEAGSPRLNPEVVVYHGVRLGGEADAPEALEPRGGTHARLGLGAQGSGWSVQVALAYDGLHVAFRSGRRDWDPDATGLRRAGRRGVGAVR